MKPNAENLPDWAREIITAYESGAASQFVLYGNLQDRFALGGSLGSLHDFFLGTLLPRFDVVLSYDLGNGIRVEKGAETFAQWPGFKEAQPLPKAPRLAIELLTRYFRYGANLRSLDKPAPQVGCIVRAAHLVVPAAAGALSHELGALALLLREWSDDQLLAGHTVATFLLTENLNDLQPMLVYNPRVKRVKLPLPGPAELSAALTYLAPKYPVALREYAGKLETVAQQWRGVMLSSIETELKVREHRGEPLRERDVAELRKQVVERDCEGLIDFIEPKKTLDDMHGQPQLKAMLRQDFTLWRQNDLAAIPMGYLVCGPVGTGKTYLVECLAGEADVPVVKIKNFRDRWVGSTEGNLEKIFRLLGALGRCFVFVDEADQALGKREGGNTDGGLSGRIYSMFATEMSRPENRGRIVWVLATSRPDLVEIDLKRPGRIDVKIPIFPTANAQEGFGLLRALCKRRGVELEEAAFAELEGLIPSLLTPGAAEALALKIYRTIKVENLSPAEAVKRSLRDYQHPVPLATLQQQIALAANEATDIEFVPPIFRPARS